MVSTIPSSTTSLLYQEWDPAFNLTPEPTRAEVRRWPKHLREQRRAQLHTMRMTRFRNRKTAERRNMLEEHQSLENELAIRLAELHRSRTSSVASQSHVRRKLQQLVLDREG